MLSDQRQFEMREWILREGKACIHELAEMFSVSSETVRRDLNAICTDGKIKKVHGGAVAVRGMILREPDYRTRQKNAVREKREIARQAARLIQDNDIIAIDTGTCMEALVREIYHVHNLCIITASLTHALILTQKIEAGDFDGRVILLGGTVSQAEQHTYGAATIAMLRNYYIDKAFIAATSISVDGIMAWNENDGEFTAALIRQARFCCALAESEKLGVRTFYRAAGLEEIDLLITDPIHPMDSEMTAALQGADVEIQTALESKENKTDENN